MPERSDISVDWGDSPRLIEVANPSTILVLQDLHDTLRSEDLGAGEADLDNLDDDYIIDSAGKEDLGGGVQVGITCTIQDGQIAFESRLTPAVTGTITATDSDGLLLVDSFAKLITSGIKRGAVVINFDDQSVTEILKVIDESTAITRVLRAGTTNQFILGDAYKIWNITQCEVSGGNATALDNVGQPLNPIFPTAFTQIIRTSSSSATINSADLSEVWAANPASATPGTYGDVVRKQAFGHAIWVDKNGGAAGTGYPKGTPLDPVNNISDAVIIGLAEGIYKIKLIEDITVLATDDISGFTLEASHAAKSDITIQAGAVTHLSQFVNCVLQGTLGGWIVVRDSVMDTVFDFQGIAHQTMIQPGGLTVTGLQGSYLLDCYSGSEVDAAEIGWSGAANPSLSIQGHKGCLKFVDKAGDAEVSIGLLAGHVIIDGTVSGGAFDLDGLGTLASDDSTGTTVINHLTNPNSIAAAVWGALIASYQGVGTFGEYVKKKLLDKLNYFGSN